MRTGRNHRIGFRCGSPDHWDMRTGRNRGHHPTGAVSGIAHWRKATSKEVCPKSRSLGYAHWPELAAPCDAACHQSRSLGYAHWPEPTPSRLASDQSGRSLGTSRTGRSIDGGRNYDLWLMSLDHWDMRTGRNHLRALGLLAADASLDHWDMRTGFSRMAWHMSYCFSALRQTAPPP